MQFSLHLTDLNYCFFQHLQFEEFKFSWYSSYLLYLLLWKPIKPDIFKKLTVLGSYLLKWYIMEALFNGRLKLVVMVGLLSW